MSKTEKLIEKLKSGRITGTELETLLGKLGWKLLRTKGSHQSWSNGKDALTLVATRKDLLSYQVKAAQQKLLRSSEKDEDEEEEE